MVHWGDIPVADENGIILSYTVTYIALPFGSLQTEVVNAPVRQLILTGLNEYTKYNITVFASTAKGDGNVSTPIIVVTDEDSKFSLIIQLQAFIPLYIDQKSVFNQFPCPIIRFFNFIYLILVLRAKRSSI